ncbi:MAG: hypothetical protein EU529_07165 [Promethearchaeota archaeon]|nr:MAG: hypothetical protein EU529_07165 [Candidatus Lokiarchaeota archaeon]
MEKENFNQIVTKITKLILTNQQKMIREEDLKNLCEGSNFDQIINEVYLNLRKVGFELITTKFLDQKYFVLTSEGKDDNITPSQYGTLALIVALSKEVDENIKVDDLKEIFSEVWSSDVKFLIENDYLRKISIDDLELVKITPLGKAALKNIIQNIQLKNLLEIFKDRKL